MACVQTPPDLGPGRCTACTTLRSGPEAQPAQPHDAGVANLLLVLHNLLIGSSGLSGCRGAGSIPIHSRPSCTQELPIGWDLLYHRKKCGNLYHTHCALIGDRGAGKAVQYLPVRLQTRSLMFIKFYQRREHGPSRLCPLTRMVSRRHQYEFLNRKR